MKKFTKFAALFLTLALVFSFAACSNQGKTAKAPDGKAPEAKVTIVGDWKCSIDMSKAIEQSMEDSGKDVAQYFDFSGLKMVMNLTFKEDGTVRMSADAKKLIEDIRQPMKEGLVKYIESLGMTEEDFESASGMKLSSMIDELVNQMASSDDLAMEKEGKYKLEGDKLFLIEDGEEFKDDDYCTITLSADEFRITEIHGELEDDDTFETMKNVLPLVFTR